MTFYHILAKSKIIIIPNPLILVE
ncbi:hypothetical protein CY0110_16742 [Crocosphaera chwakensis CCY0110]|uniref:Uncharacterized protein n=1 Tax=Crocosphaera chwakensis CCY0110 TaxID=391612 RepID=A3II30_9CHRO|nr:hypothetical protein CY0110_16742 [Crocosphaera chwakensis CCY0110]